MAKCELCGAEVELPFQCSYCGKHLCEAHRLLENHNCPNAPPRTPLGSHQVKQMLASTSKEKEMITLSSETKTYGNIYNHSFNVPIEVYSDETYREKLDKARTLEEVDKILHDYRKHHRK
jgi:hypothetical protein